MLLSPHTNWIWACVPPITLKCPLLLLTVTVFFLFNGFFMSPSLPLDFLQSLSHSWKRQERLLHSSPLSPRILSSLWYTRWLAEPVPDHKTLFFSLSSLCATLFLTFLPSIPLYASLPLSLPFRLILQQGHDMAAGLSYHFFLEEDLQLFPTLAPSTIHHVCFVKLFGWEIIHLNFTWLLARCDSSYILTALHALSISWYYSILARTLWYIPIHMWEITVMVLSTLLFTIVQRVCQQSFHHSIYYCVNP